MPPVKLFPMFLKLADRPCIVGGAGIIAESKISSLRVPLTFQLGAILPCSAFLASRKINKLRVFNTHKYSDSPASTIFLIDSKDFIHSTNFTFQKRSSL